MANNKAIKAEKVLRIGVIQNQSMQNERLIFPGESVTIGEAPFNTFSFAIDSTFPPSFNLFESKDGRYYLNFTQEMKGKIAEGGKDAFEISSLVSSDAAIRNGNTFSYPLKESARGKVTVGEFGFLFQFIAAPPMRNKPNYDYNPKFIGDDDVPFLCFLGLFTMFAIVMGIYVYNLPELEMFEEDDMVERYAKMVLDEEIVVEETPVEEPDDSLEETDDGSGDPIEEVPPEEVPPEKPENVEDQKDAIENQTVDSQEAAKSAANDTAVMQALGSLAENTSGGAVYSVFDGDDSNASSVDEILAEQGSKIATTGSVSSIKGQSDSAGRADTDVGKGGKVGKNVGGKKVGSGPKAKSISANMKMESADLDGADSGCAAQIKKVLKRKRSQVKLCYEKRLKENPSLRGRVVIGVEILDNGKTTGIDIMNGTKDKALTSCIKRKVKLWRFGKNCATFADFPFVLAPGKN
jgi:hypothetical protein